MSFTQETKKDITSCENSKRSKKIFLVSMLSTILEKKEKGYKIKTDNDIILSKLQNTYKEIYNKEFDVNGDNEKKLYEKMLLLEGERYFEVNNEVIITINDKKDYIRGVFAACGSISNPNTGYHIEMVTYTNALSKQVMYYLNSFELNAKISKRKNMYFVYIKEADKISDLIKILGTVKSLTQFEEIRVYKEIGNKINRDVNCEVANMSKIVTTGMKQKAEIEYIINTEGFEYIPTYLKDVAIARLENVNVSLKEIGESLNPPISKSLVNYKLKKIMQLSYEIKESKGEI